MTAAEVAAQVVAGLAAAATLFLGASGLALIFSVARIVDFAHGAFVLLGAWVACDVAVRVDGPAGFWCALAAAIAVTAVLGAVVQAGVVRPLLDRPPLAVLLATFGVGLIVRDAVWAIWGAEDRLAPLPVGLDTPVAVGDAFVPRYDLFLIVVAIAVWLALEALLARTRFGLRVRAAAADPEMLTALGVRASPLLLAVFALGSALAGLGGGLAAARDGATLSMDLSAVTDAFVVVVTGGLGSLRGALAASVLIGLVKAACALAGRVAFAGVAFDAPRAVAVIEFVLMALVLVWRPGGLAGRMPEVGPARSERHAAPAARWLPARRALALAVAGLGAVAVATLGSDWAAVLTTEIAIAVLVAASVQWLLGPGGMAPFGHAAFVGIGAYATGLALLRGGAPWPLAIAAGALAAGAAGAVVGAACTRLGGVRLAMFTLAFAQVAWSVATQWDGVTGGSNGLVGTAPAGTLGTPRGFVAVAVILATAGVAATAALARSAFGARLRAVRDAPQRAAASGIDGPRVQARAFVFAAAIGGVGGAVVALAKGSLSPDLMAIPRSVDALVMVLLGGVQSVAGAVVGAVSFTLLQDSALRHVPYWRMAVGALVLALVLGLPRGIAGIAWPRRRAR